MTKQTKAQRLAGYLEGTSEIASEKYGVDWENIHEAAAELRRLDRHEQATRVWSKKTEWVQETAKPGELGMHRADVMKKRIDDLTALNAELVEALDDAIDSIGRFTSEEGSTDRDFDILDNAIAALAKAKEQT